MFYKEIKYLAAHWLLGNLKAECRIYTKYGDIEMYKPSYLWTNLLIMKKSKWFSIETLKDAAWLLMKNKQIDILKNDNYVYDIELGILDEGVTAFKERTYIWKALVSWKIIVVGIVSTTTTCITLLKFIPQ